MAPRLLPYDTRVNPQGARTPYRRNVDVRDDTARSLAQAGQAIDRYADAEIQIERMRVAQEEDDARIWTARAMAQWRGEEIAARRSAFDNAQDGWRGAMETHQGWLARTRQERLAAAPTDAARRFVELAIDVDTPQLLAQTAEQERSARQAWRLDEISATVDDAASAIVADPRQYDVVRAQTLETMRGISDLTADQRRDIEENIERSFAGAAVSGLIDRDPHGALRMLRAREDGTLAERLSPGQLQAAIDKAQNEIDRRAAVARAQFSARMNEQMLKMELGMEVPDLVTPEQVESVLGRPAALEWRQRTTVQRYANDPSITRATSDHLLRLASRPLPETDSPEQRINNIALRQAAALQLRQRQEDPRAWTERRYGIQSQNFGALMDQARRSGNYDAVGRELMERVSYAGQAREQGVAPVLLTRAEAEQTRAMLANPDMMNSAQRAQFWQVMRGVLGPGDSYRLRQQLASDSPAMAAAAEHASRADGAQRAQRFDRGAQLLATGRADEGGGDQGASGSSTRRGSPFRLQGSDIENKLIQSWRLHVGTGARNIYGGNYQAMERDFEAFRAYYAALADESGWMEFNPTGAAEAANATTGNVGEWNGRRTMLPGRMTQESAERSMRAAWPDMERRYGVGRFENYEFAALGVVNDPNSRHEGWTRYAVMEGGQIVRDRDGNPVYIHLINEQR